MALLKQPFRLASLTWPPTAGQWKALSDMLDDIYQRLKEGVDSIPDFFTELVTGFTIAGGTTTPTTLTVAADASVAGTNTGDQTITLTADITGSGTGSFATTLATVNANVGTFGSATAIPVVTVNAKGLVTGVSETAIVAGVSSSSIFTRVMLRN